MGEVQITTTAAIAGLNRPVLPRFGFGAVSGAALAALFFAFMPARRRSWRALIGIFLLLFIFAGVSACGGGGGGSTGSTGNTGGTGGTGGGTNTSGTTPGLYTFTVTGTGNPAVTPAPTTTFTLTVN